MEFKFKNTDIDYHGYNKNQHYKYNYAKKIYCVSNGIATQSINENLSLRIRTTWNPKYYLPRNENSKITPELVAYKTWEISKKYSIASLVEIVEKYKRWKNDIPIKIQNEPGFKIDSDKWDKEIDAITLGIKLLSISQDYYEINNFSTLSSIYKSWCYLNESFSLIDKKYEDWRLFQMCFLLTLIPSIVLKDEKIVELLIRNNSILQSEVDTILLNAENRVNLLFFNAGGGKTEAFLGVLIYSLFFERLNGFTHGLTAMIKYPLRLLLTQQTNRVLKAICSAEKIRRKYKIAFDTDKSEPEMLFDRSFSLGIWVGSSSSPNTIEQAKKGNTVFELKDNASLKIIKDGVTNNDLAWENKLINKYINLDTEPSEKNRIELELREKSLSKIPSFNLEEITKRSVSIGDLETDSEEIGHKKLNKCPFCDEEHIVLRVYQDSLLHFCLNKKCEWNITIDSYRPLPFYIIDDDIYSRYPSVIISTTDKLARFGYLTKGNDGFSENRYPLGMFGVAPYYESETKKILWDFPNKEEPNIFPFATNKNKLIDLKFKPPSIIIQDETHLLIEGLGSFSAVFERNYIELIKELHIFFTSNLNEPNKKLHLPQIIASTATMASPEKQLLPIYNKQEVLLFPSSGYKIYENFYSKPEIKDEKYFVSNSEEECETYNISRIYNGFFLNDFNYYRAIKRYSFDYHNLIYSLYDSGINIDFFKSKLRNKYYLEIFNKITSEDDFIFSDFIKENSLLNKILINYAGSKNVNDKLKSLEIYLFDKNKSIKTALVDGNQVSITSDIDQKILQSVLGKIVDQSRDSLNGTSSHEIIKSIFATQSISHGVDSDMFNAMTFHGFPEFTNEYIQASARIGRTNVGFVNCFPLPNNKDSLIMNNFESFHRFIERPVLSNSIDFTTKRIISRTILSLFTCWFFNINRFKNDLQNIKNSKLKKINELLINQINFNSFSSDFKIYTNKIFNSGLDTNIKKMIDDEIDELLCKSSNDDIGGIQKIHDLAGGKYYIMTSLRDTQETAQIYIKQK